MTLQFDFDDEFYIMLETQSKIRLKHSGIHEHIKSIINMDRDSKQYCLYIDDKKIYSTISKNNNLHELDISKIMSSNHSRDFDVAKIKFILSNLIFPQQLKILKLPEFCNLFTSNDNSIIIKLNDGLEELYISHIDILTWCQYLPLSLKKITVDKKYTLEELAKYYNMLPYSCTIQFCEYIFKHR